MRPRRRSGEAGFTLVEALLVMVLAGLVMSALGLVTAQWLPGWKRDLDRVRATDRLALGLDRIAADLAAAEFVGGGPGRRPFFEGSAASVAFLRSALGPDAGPGLDIVTLREVPEPGGFALVRGAAPFAPGLAGAAIGAPVVLVRPPFRARFAYAGLDGVWRDGWSGERMPPRRVRITIFDGRAGAGPLLSTETSLRVELPATCAAARSLQSCLTGLREGDDTAPATGDEL